MVKTRFITIGWKLKRNHYWSDKDAIPFNIIRENTLFLFPLIRYMNFIYQILVINSVIQNDSPTFTCPFLDFKYQFVFCSFILPAPYPTFVSIIIKIDQT